jgi:hypothetical protein
MRKLPIMVSIVALFLLSNLVSAEIEHEERDLYSRYEHQERDYERGDAHRPQIARKKKKHAKIPRTSTGATQTGSVHTGATTPPPKPTQPSTSTTRSTITSYGTPDGSATVAFSVTVKDGLITSATSTRKAGGTSGYYQDAFAGGLSRAVVGKKASSLSLSAIG